MHFNQHVLEDLVSIFLEATYLFTSGKEGSGSAVVLKN